MSFNQGPVCEALMETRRLSLRCRGRLGDGHGAAWILADFRVYMEPDLGAKRDVAILTARVASRIVDEEASMTCLEPLGMKQNLPPT